MHVLLTGHRGFIGRWLAHELLDAGHTCIGLDIHADPYDPDEAPDPLFDLRRAGKFRDRLWECDPLPDVVVHLAAQVGRLFGEQDIVHTVQSNAQMTTLIAHACGETGVRLAYASTSEVYGDQGETLCTEGGPFVLPHNLYGLTKRWGEEACELYAPDGLVRLRFSMPYGPGVPPGRGRAALPNILWQAHTRQRIPIHRGAERSWCWVGDTVRAVRLVLESGQGGAWNVGRDDHPLPMEALAHRACQMTGAPRSLVDLIDAPAAQTVVKRLSTARLRTLGWKPFVELEDGMAKTLEWVRQFDAQGQPVVA